MAGTPQEPHHDRTPAVSEEEQAATDKLANAELVLFSKRVGVILVALMLIALTAVVSHAIFDSEPDAAAPPAKPLQSAETAEPTIETKGAENIKFEPYQRPSPALPPIPPGEVKKFKVDVYEHVTKVAADKPPTRVWSFGVNDVFYRGTGASVPMVVEQGDKVEITLINGGSEEMDVRMPHSIDYHSSELAPNEAFKTIPPGEKHKFRFTAKHPGVFMYHCATNPVLLHTGAGMVGAMIVKPKNLPKVDRELWINQQEYYFGAPGKEGDIRKMQAKEPDVIAFNGFASQYQEKPVKVKKDERIRIYVLNSGPSIWSAFHVIGTVFDRTVVEGMVGHDAQTINLAPSQGGWVEFTLDREGSFPFVTHAFGDAVKGAIGVLATEDAPAGDGHGGGDYDHGKRNPTDSGAPAEAGKGTVMAELGEMFLRPSVASAKEGEVTFQVTNSGSIPHTLTVGKTPVKLDESGTPDQESEVATTKEIPAGKTETLKVKLDKGSYELYCKVIGHYPAGQKAAFTVR